MNRRLVLYMAATLLPGIAGTAGAESPPGYDWQPVADGVFLHTRRDPLAGPVDGNAVIIVSGSGVVAIDTHLNPAAARAVIARLRAVSDEPVTHVVNTHWHDDHTNGNQAFRQVFPDVSILAHRATLEALRREWAPMEDQRREAYAGIDAPQLLRRADELDATEPERAMGLRVYAGYVEALKPELRTLDLVYPDTVFGERFVIGDDGARQVIIEWLGRGNTDGDVVAWIPDVKVLVTGDLLVAPVPFAFDAPMADWIDTLERLRAYGAEIIIPGHGQPLTDNRHIDRVLALLRNTMHAVREAHDDGVTYGELAAAVDLSADERRFTEGDAAREFAWRMYYFEPALKSAWVSLGYPLPEDP